MHLEESGVFGTRDLDYLEPKKRESRDNRRNEPLAWLNISYGGAKPKNGLEALKALRDVKKEPKAC